MELGQTQKQKGIGLRILRNIVHTRNYDENKTQANCDSLLALSIDTQTTSGKIGDLSLGLQRDSTGSVLDRLSDYRNTSFAAASPSPAVPRPFARNASGSGSVALQTTESISTLPVSDIALVANIFTGFSFRAFGEAKEGAMLRDAITKHGGRWLDDGNSHIEPDFFLVRLAG